MKELIVEAMASFMVFLVGATCSYLISDTMFFIVVKEYLIRFYVGALIIGGLVSHNILPKPKKGGNQ